MNELLAAAFGIASNQIAKSINELFEAYNKLTKAGIQLTAQDKAEFNRHTKRINELWQYVHDVEFNAMIDRLRKDK